MVDHMQ